MTLIKTEPVRTFIDSIGKKPIHTLRLAFPFITTPLVSQLIVPAFKKKKTRIQLISNLSSFNVAISLNNPCEPLIDLYEIFGDRIEIRSNPILHGKVMIADDRRAVFGSSNLTSGGETRNREINALLRSNTSDGKVQIADLLQWFDMVFDEAVHLSVKQLYEISTRWKKNSKKYKALLSSEPRLGDNYWQKVKKLASRSKTSLQDTKLLLASKEEKAVADSLKNFERKLLFLQEAGIVSHWDEKWVYRYENAQQSAKSPESFLPILRQLVPASIDVFKTIRRNKVATYKDLHTALLIYYEEQEIHIAANWLVHLGFVDMEKISGNLSQFNVSNHGKKCTGFEDVQRK